MPKKVALIAASATRFGKFVRIAAPEVFPDSREHQKLLLGDQISIVRGVQIAEQSTSALRQVAEGNRTFGLPSIGYF